MRTDSTIYVAGMDTLIGAAILRCLRAEGYGPLTEDEPDLTCADAVEAFFTEYEPEYVVHAAASAASPPIKNTLPISYVTTCWSVLSSMRRIDMA